MSGPQLSIEYKQKIHPVYILDADKGVSVKLDISRAEGLASLFCDPGLVCNVLDEAFISKASKLKPDYKQLLGVGLFSAIIFFLFGLMF